MKFIKKYWWVVLIIVVVLLFFIVSSPITNKDNEQKNCTDIPHGEWDAKKQAYYDQFGDWKRAHLAMLDDGYCEIIS